MTQTTIQKSAALREGSAKLEIGANFGALSDIGAVRNIKFNSKKRNFEIKFDNVAAIQKFADGDRFSVTFDMNELDLVKLQIMEAGWMTNSNVAGTPVAGATQAITGASYAYNDFIEIEHQNGDGSVITINSVTGSTNGALVADTDYVLIQNEEGNYGIAIIDSATVTTMSQVFTIDYDYTPNAAIESTFAQFGTKTKKVLRLTNTNSASKDFVVEMTDVTNVSQISLPFLADDAEDIMSVSIELEGAIVDWHDEQSTT